MMLAVRAPQKDYASHPYALRPATDADIPQVNRMLWDEYGESYPYPVKELNPEYIYVVAVHEQTGEIVGFSRAAPYEGHDGVWELGGLIVTRPHRKRDVAKRMTILRMQELRSRGAKIAMSEPVSYRVDCASQLNLLGFGFVLLGILPGKYPDIQREILHGQPESVVMAANWLSGESEFGTRRIFLPHEYRGLPYTYLPREIHSRHFQRPLEGDVPEVVHHQGRAGLGYVGAEFVDIPANWQRSAAIMSDYIRQGYRFACILPSFGDLSSGGHFDYIRLYRFHDSMSDFDFRHVHVAPHIAPLKFLMAGEHACRR